MSSNTQTKPDLGILEEDDEFEEFPAEDWTGAEEEKNDVNVWEDNWDDDNVEDDFSKQLRAQRSVQRHFSSSLWLLRLADKSRTRRPNEAEKYHQIKRLEALGDQIITSAQFMFSFSKWASPFIILYLYRHGYCTNPNNMVVVVRFMSGAAAIYLFAMCTIELLD
ncbi:SHFM1 [Acanthosepion pharaonis]|uniref:26S proteasome complex subunit SEM1 n=1 Tax=Acanthosepion pharaonis TaxID=158019 RepID=A0A812EEN9_ACAPH|nr:SHFM1 [Sepia pharaonis]